MEGSECIWQATGYSGCFQDLRRQTTFQGYTDIYRYRTLTVGVSELSCMREEQHDRY
jgi:hypothetical protein